MLNSVIISGNLVQDAEALTKNGSLIKFVLGFGTPEKVGDKWEIKSNFIECVMFGNRAKNIYTYLTKGKKVTLAGAIQQDCWEKEGKKYYKIVVKVDDIEFAGTKR